MDQLCEVCPEGEEQPATVYCSDSLWRCEDCANLDSHNTENLKQGTRDRNNPRTVRQVGRLAHR